VGRVLLGRPRATLIVACGLIGAALAASMLNPDRFTVAGFSDPASQSSRALSVLHRALGHDPEPGMVILARSSAGFGASTARAAVARLAARVARDPAVGRVQTAFGGGGLPELLSRSAHETLLLVYFRSSSQEAVVGPVDHLRSRLHQPGLMLAFDGYDTGVVDVNRIVRADLVRAELIAFPLLIVLMLLVFRGLLAAAIPIATATASVAATFACLRLLGGALQISIFALDLAVLLGLGLAVDYGLFLVSRYREEALTRGTGVEAIRVTLATAGRAVAFSGCAVAGACAALLVFPEDFIYSMGIAGILVALFSATAALVIVPPLLLLWGPRLSPRSAPQSARSYWYRWPRWVMRHPLDVALVSVLVLIAAAAQALRLAPTFPDLNAVPHGFQTRTVADEINREFVPYLEYPVSIALDLAIRGHAEVPPALLETTVAHAPGVALVAPLELVGRNTAMLQLVLRNPPLSQGSQSLVTALRALRLPLLVGGTTAEFVDLKHSIAQHAPLALLVALAATIVPLLLLTGSLALSIKALLFDALGLSAAFGLLVLIFQDHALGISALLGYKGPAAIDTTASVVMLASTLGLTTDYSILLLSRITEEHEAGRPDEQAVALGIQRSGPVITSSALLLVVALLALASSRVFLVKELTIGQVLGVVIDVTFVRMLLVPSCIRLLGPLNWWAPGPLRRVRAQLAKHTRV
jgi:uncharacterized membrane protein YdfJ with MMPL/SSD domain